MTKKTNDNADVTANSKQIEILKKEFPQCFDKKGNFIAEKLLDIVSNSGSDLSKESYSLNWLGKSYARLLANENPRTLLSADTVHNAKAEHKNSENLLIKGDNLEVLKHLVNAYSEQVKMIYIDPPYNTGSDGFVYQDDRQFTYQQLSQLAGIDNDEAKRILNFTQSKANSHSAWLTFMYPRLYVARELLRDDGVIFISIDDNEVAQLKILCDEVFGEQNFITSFIWQNKKGGGNDSSYVAIEHESILMYCRDKASLNKLFETYSPEYLTRYKLEDSISKYYWDTLKRKSGKQYYPITCPDGSIIELDKHGNKISWLRSEKRVREDLINGDVRIHKLESKWSVQFKQRLPKGKKPRSILITESLLDNVATTSDGSKNILELFGVDIFENPKPLALIIKFINIIVSDNDLILDFFAGSGTTAHAVMQLNAEDGGRRHCISVQIDEQTDPKKEASKKYKTIFDITKARIEKAAAKIKAAHPDYKGNLGFKLFETKAIADSYLNDMTVLSADQPDLPIISTNTGDVLTTWSIYDGIALTQSLVDVDLAGYIAQQHNKICYFMDEGFSNSALVAFLHKLDDTSNNFEVEKVVVYGPHFDSKHQREISESLNQYQNRKDKKLSIEFRY